jgi:acetyl esterase
MMSVQESQVVYYASGQTALRIHLFLPDPVSEYGDTRAAILFFHGGRFVQGHPAQFFPHCRYLATRGMVAASAQYRLLGKGATSIRDCLRDSRNAIRWLRTHAGELAIDPERIAAGGGSAGANLAANAAMDLHIADENATSINSRPDALILFSPAVIRPILPQDLIDEELYANLSAKPQVPPMLLLHGTDDEIFATDSMQEFCTQIVAAGNVCELKLFQGGKHGFFNFGRDDNLPFYQTVLEMDRFLYDLGMLSGEPTLTYEMIASLRHDQDWQI